MVLQMCRLRDSGCNNERRKFKIFEDAVLTASGSSMKCSMYCTARVRVVEYEYSKQAVEMRASERATWSGGRKSDRRT